MDSINRTTVQTYNPCYKTGHNLLKWTIFISTKSFVLKKKICLGQKDGNDLRPSNPVFFLKTLNSI